MGRSVLNAIVIAMLTVALAACAGKRNRFYTGQCAIPGHWFCGKVYDSFADCNNARKRHDHEVSMPGTCFSGRRDGAPDTRTM